MKELRVIIAGSRDFDDFPKLMNSSIEILTGISKKRDDLDRIRIISGTARGADKLGEQYAKISGYELSKFPAAFWDGKSKGTKHMIDLAKRYGLEVHVVNYKG